MTRGFEGSQVGATPIEEGMPQKTARKKLLMMRNGTPPDVGPDVVLGDDVLGGGLGVAATAFAARLLAFTPALQSSSLRFFDILIW